MTPEGLQQHGDAAAPQLLPPKRPRLSYVQWYGPERRCIPLTQSPKHNPPSHTDPPKVEPVVHNVNVQNVHLLNSIKVSFCPQNTANQMSQSGQVSLSFSGTLEGVSPSPTVLQVSRLAVHLPRWHTCAVPPWVERTVVMGYRLQFRARPPRFSSVINTAVRNEAAAVLREEINNLLAKRAIRVVPASEANRGWYSLCLLFRRKGEGSVLY